MGCTLEPEFSSWYTTVEVPDLDWNPGDTIEVDASGGAVAAFSASVVLPPLLLEESISPEGIDAGTDVDGGASADAGEAGVSAIRDDIPLVRVFTQGGVETNSDLVSDVFLESYQSSSFQPDSYWNASSRFCRTPLSEVDPLADLFTFDLSFFTNSVQTSLRLVTQVELDVNGYPITVEAESPIGVPRRFYPMKSEE